MSLWVVRRGVFLLLVHRPASMTVRQALDETTEKVGEVNLVISFSFNVYSDPFPSGLHCLLSTHPETLPRVSEKT